MAVKIPMPDLGKAMKEGVVVKWLKEDMARVEQGERIAVVMSKKITYQVEAPASGFLRHAARLKETKPIGAPIAFITESREEILEVGVPSEAVAAPDREALPPVPVEEKEKKEFVLASPAARRLAKEKGVNLAQIKGSGPEGRVVEADIYSYLERQAAEVAAPAPAAEKEEFLATPSARWLAKQRGIDLSQVPGSGPGKRITEQDVEKFLAAIPAAPAPPAVIPAGTIPFIGMRQSIAEHMMNSLQQSAQLTLTTKVDVTELVKLRDQLKAEFSLTYTDLVIKAVAKTLKLHPRLNSTLIGDEICLLPEIHIGMAVALEEGVIVPVIRDADRKNLEELAMETQRLAKAAREGTLTVDEVTGSTFTVTNLGAYGIDFFTPIINMPEVAILGVGRIVDKPAFFQDQILRRSFVSLSLTIDHRIVDGVPGAEFLQALGDLLSNSYRLMR